MTNRSRFAAVFFSGLALLGCARESNSLPYAERSAVIGDNDSHEDTYTDELLLALHTLGQIELKGLITTNGGWRDPWDSTRRIADHMLVGRRELVAKAIRSGMAKVDVYDGPTESLQRPPSRRIEDGLPFGTPAGRAIVAAAKDATFQRPLVVALGGPATSLADAYLLDPAIAGKVVAAWLAEPGSEEFNANALPFRWATDIVLTRFRVVVFPPRGDRESPIVPKSRLQQLPNTELRRYMIDKHLPHVNLPRNIDGDANPVISLFRHDYVERVVRQRWSVSTRRLENDPKGQLWVVTRANQQVATETWWRVMADLRSWGGVPQSPRAHPLRDTPLRIPGLIEAEWFDEGGPDVAYSDTDTKSWSDSRHRNPPTFRVTEHVDLKEIPDASGRLLVTNIEPSEWLTYSVDVESDGNYLLEIGVAGNSAGGRFRIELDGDTVAVVTVPATTASLQLRVKNVPLNAGRCRMRIYFEEGGLNLDYLRWSLWR